MGEGQLQVCTLSRNVAAAKNMNSVWKGQNKYIKLKMLGSCTFPVATYACEIWIRGPLRTDENSVTAFENKCSWTASPHPLSVQAFSSAILRVDSCTMLLFIVVNICMAVKSCKWFSRLHSTVVLSAVACCLVVGI